MEATSLLPGLEIGTGLELGWCSWGGGGGRVRRETEARLPIASRPQEEAHAEEDLQQIDPRSVPASGLCVAWPSFLSSLIRMRLWV